MARGVGVTRMISMPRDDSGVRRAFVDELGFRHSSGKEECDHPGLNFTCVPQTLGFAVP